MIEMTEEQWNGLFDAADEIIQKAMSELPDPIRKTAETWTCWLEKYSPRSTDTEKILGICVMYGQGICVYVGEIYEYVKGNHERFVEEVRHVYFHELAHAIGKLNEAEVKERGL
jgi:hypothetical protein